MNEETKKLAAEAAEQLWHGGDPEAMDAANTAIIQAAIEKVIHQYDPNGVLRDRAAQASVHHVACASSWDQPCDCGAAQASEEKPMSKYELDKANDEIAKLRGMAPGPGPPVKCPNCGYIFYEQTKTTRSSRTPAS